MIDVEDGYNPLVKDVALDSSGKIYAMITYEQLDGSKVYWWLYSSDYQEIHIINVQMMRIQRYDQCGEYIDGFDVQERLVIKRFNHYIFHFDRKSHIL